MKEELGLVRDVGTELTEKQAEFIALHRDIMSEGGTAAEYFLRMCRDLKKMNDLKLYETAGYANFADYTENAVGIKVRQAYNYISICEKYSAEFLAENSHLGVTKLLVLSKIGEEEAKEVVTSEDVKNTSVEELKRLIDERDKRIRDLEKAGIEATKNEYEAKEAEYAAEKSRMQANFDKAISERDEAKRKYDKAVFDRDRLKEENKALKNAPKETEKVENPETIKELERAKRDLEEKERALEALKKKLLVASNDNLTKFKVKFNDFQTVISDISEIVKELDEPTKDKCVKAMQEVIKGAAL